MLSICRVLQTRPWFHYSERLLWPNPSLADSSSPDKAAVATTYGMEKDATQPMSFWEKVPRPASEGASEERGRKFRREESWSIVRSARLATAAIEKERRNDRVDRRLYSTSWEPPTPTFQFDLLDPVLICHRRISQDLAMSTGKKWRRHRDLSSSRTNQSIF